MPPWKIPQLAARLEREALEIRKGYREPPKLHNKHAARTFEDAAAEYLAWGEAQGGRGGRPWSAGHVQKRRQRLLWWPERIGVRTLRDMSGILPKVEAALRDFGNTGKTPKTLQNYAEALNAFCHWATQRGY